MRLRSSYLPLLVGLMALSPLAAEATCVTRNTVPLKLLNPRTASACTLLDPLASIRARDQVAVIGAVQRCCRGRGPRAQERCSPSSLPTTTLKVYDEQEQPVSGTWRLRGDRCLGLEVWLFEGQLTPGQYTIRGQQLRVQFRVEA